MKDSERRDFYAKGLSPLYLPKYRALGEKLSPEWQPYYGERSIALQDALYAKGRTTPGAIVTHAPGGSSAHNYGCGSDWTLFNDGAPIWLKSDDPKWHEYRDACVAVGLKWGGDFKVLPDLYHNELELSCSWGVIGKEYLAKGNDAAFSLIAKSMINLETKGAS